VYRIKIQTDRFPIILVGFIGCILQELINVLIKFTKNSNFMKRLAYLICLGIFMTSCITEGPTGPMGPTGTAGINGTNGLDGTNGVNGRDGINGTNGVASCSGCHIGDKILAKQMQYNTSVHALGEDGTSNYAYSKNQAFCAGCHNNEGFNQRIMTGENFIYDSLQHNAPYNPVSVISCYTCHNIHTKYDSTDIALKGMGPITVMQDSSATIPAGKSNVCINCHQSRPFYMKGYLTKAVVDITTPSVSKLKNAVNTDSVDLYSSINPHDGPQGNLWAGVGLSGAYELAGTENYVNHEHSSIANCITCHMGGNPTQTNAGGHSFSTMYYKNATDQAAGIKTLNTNACIVCHNVTGVGKKYNTAAAVITQKAVVQGDVKKLLQQLKVILATKHFLDTGATAGAVGSIKLYNPTTKKFTGLSYTTTPKVKVRVTAVQAKVFYNYQFINNDMSFGIHNPDYAEALLKNSIAEASKW